MSGAIRWSLDLPRCWHWHTSRCWGASTGLHAGSRRPSVWAAPWAASRWQPDGAAGGNGAKERAEPETELKAVVVRFPPKGEQELEALLGACSPAL